jgi:hypothetical protein
MICDSLITVGAWLSVMTDRKIQKVELRSFYYVAICCPFCGQKVSPGHSDLNDRGEPLIVPCRHTLFVAHDEGFAYRAARFDEDIGLSDEDAALEAGIDALTDRVSLPDAVKFASYVSAPSEFGCYVGFAPVDSD